MLPSMRYETKKLTELYHKKKFISGLIQVVPGSPPIHPEDSP